MTGTIPASTLVSVNPEVVGTGGNPLAINGMVLTQNSLVPTGGVLSFTSDDAVSDFFGPASAELAAAETYFLGNDNSSIKPNKLFFAPYVPTGGVAAFLQSGSFAGVTLTQLQAISGTLILTVDSTSETSASINLSAATSFSNAATLIQTAFASDAVHVTCAWNAVNSTFTISSPVLGASSTLTFATGTAATALQFTSATGAILSQGAIADTPATAMANVIANTQNWVLFTTMFEPATADKENFAIWTNAQNQRYGYIAWDTDVTPTESESASSSFGFIADELEYDAVCPVWNTLALAMFVLGTAACINFNAAKGRITFAFKKQSGFVPTVSNAQVAANLGANGYSFYGVYANATNNWNDFQNGQVSGQWKWLDTFVNQVYLNSQFQTALMDLLEAVNSIPYNAAGYGLIRSAMLDPIIQFINFGGIQKGVELSSAEAAEVNTAAGLTVSGIIESEGWYLQILDPGAQVRGNRGTPIINFWYTDGGAVQQITLASIDVQ